MHDTHNIARQLEDKYARKETHPSIISSAC